MTSRTLVKVGAPIALVIVTIAMLWSPTEDPVDDRSAGSSAGNRTADTLSLPTAADATAVRPSIRDEAPASAVTDRAEATLASTRSEHQRAQAALVGAEADLASLELELEAVERFVEQIEARGDDPARHAFEGMERLDPLIEQLDEKMRAIEEAESQEREARRAFDAAQEQLDAARHAEP